MSSIKHGISTSHVEVLNISTFGVWIFVNEKEYFLSYEDYPWFISSKVEEIIDVELLHENHLYWKKLDVDLELDSLKNPEKYPLTYQ